MTIETTTIAEPFNKNSGFVVYVDPKTGMAVCGGDVPDIFHFPKFGLEYVPPTGGPAIVSINTTDHTDTDIATKTDMPSEPAVVSEINPVKDSGFVITVDPKTGQAVCGPADALDLFHFPKIAIEPNTPSIGPVVVSVEPVTLDHDGGFVITYDPETGQAVCGGAYGAHPKPTVSDVPATIDTHEGITLVGADSAHHDIVTL